MGAGRRPARLASPSQPEAHSHPRELRITRRNYYSRDRCPGAFKKGGGGNKGNLRKNSIFVSLYLRIVLAIAAVETEKSFGA